LHYNPLDGCVCWFILGAESNWTIIVIALIKQLSLSLNKICCPFEIKIGSIRPARVTDVMVQGGGVSSSYNFTSAQVLLGAPLIMQEHILQ
jgi:hypothetical protein